MHKLLNNLKQFIKNSPRLYSFFRKLRALELFLTPLITVRSGWIIVNIRSFPRLVKFVRQYRLYKSKSEEKLSIFDVRPCLYGSSNPTLKAGTHYFYQDIWALRKVAESKIEKHNDIGSRIDGFVGQCSAITATEFLDIRYVDYNVESLNCKVGDIKNLPYEDNSIASLSCLHVAEHIGLGRYGDEIDPNGYICAVQELQRVLSPGGMLYFSVPIGKERVEYNAHRIFSPITVIMSFEKLKLVEFSAVDDKGNFIVNAVPDDYTESIYSCGMFCFSK